MAYTKARGRAQAKWEKKAYFRPSIRFPKDAEDLIRLKSNNNINGYIVNLVLKDCGYLPEEPEREDFEELP